MGVKKLKTAVFGTGFMGRVHTEGIRRLGNVEVAAIAASSDEKAKKFGDEVGVARTTGDYRTVLNDPEIDAVHICTPNALHFPMASAALEAGKHVCARSRWQYRCPKGRSWSTWRKRRISPTARFTICAFTRWS